MYNTAPRLTSPVTVTMTEDEGINKILFNKYKNVLADVISLETCYSYNSDERYRPKRASSFSYHVVSLLILTKIKSYRTTL